MTAGSWIAGGPGRRADAPVRLLCFAHAGGGGGFFRPWAAALPGVDVCPVVLPGRESRLREHPYTRVSDLLPALVDGVVPHLDRPYALFGHSLGAVLAYELARRLSHGPAAPPVCLVVSGRRPPHAARQEPELRHLDDDAFVTEVARLGGIPDEVLRQPDLLRLFVPAMRADFTLNETYLPLPGPPLEIQVAALTGDRDPRVTPEEIDGWREVTRGPFTRRVFEGDHFYLKGARADVMAALRAELEAAAGTAPRTG